MKSCFFYSLIYFSFYPAISHYSYKNSIRCARVSLCCVWRTATWPSPAAASCRSWPSAWCTRCCRRATSLSKTCWRRAAWRTRWCATCFSWCPTFCTCWCHWCVCWPPGRRPRAASGLSWPPAWPPASPPSACSATEHPPAPPTYQPFLRASPDGRLNYINISLHLCNASSLTGLFYVSL